MIANHYGLSGSVPSTPHRSDFTPGDNPQPESARIVIVDDDPGLRELLTEFLVDHGLRAEAVDSARRFARGLDDRRAT